MRTNSAPPSRTSEWQLFPGQTLQSPNQINRSHGDPCLTHLLDVTWKRPWDPVMYIEIWQICLETISPLLGIYSDIEKFELLSSPTPAQNQIKFFCVTRDALTHHSADHHDIFIKSKSWDSALDPSNYTCLLIFMLRMLIAAKHPGANWQQHLIMFGFFM